MQIDRETGMVRLVGWPKGVDNRRSDHDIPDDTLRDGVNIDVLSSGKVRLRNGLTQRVADSNAHSGFSDGTKVVWATPTALKVADANFDSATVLTSALLAKPLSYVALHGEIYFSNEDINGKILADGTYEAWGITPPAAPPTCTPVAVGTRRYQVTCTFVTATGKESGAPIGAEVLCGDIPNIIVTAIPQSGDSRVVATRLYVTNIDGAVFYRAYDVPAGVTAWTLTGFFANGATLKTQFMEPPPPGQLLEYFDGAVYIASGSTLWHTQPLRYDLCRFDEDFFMYPERVTLLKAVDDGLYVGAEKTWFLSAAPAVTGASTGSRSVTDNAHQKEVFPYGAVERAACSLPESTDVLWMSARGVARGSAGGKAVNLTEAQVAVDSFDSGCLGVIERDGHKAVVAIMQGENAGALVAEDYVEAEALRISEVI